MAIKKYKPTTNGRRNMTSSDFAEITTSTPEKSLLQPLKNNAGRNNNGRITVRHQGGIPFCLVFVEILLKGVGRFEPGDGAADVPLQLFQMVVHLRKLEAGVTEEDLIHLAAFLQQAQEHGGRIFSTRDRGQGQNRLILLYCFVVGFKHLRSFIKKARTYPGFQR